MGISRRSFVKMAGLLSISSGALKSQAKISASRLNRSQFALVGSAGSSHGVSVYKIGDGYWQLMQFVGSESPLALAVHPLGRRLYVLNGVAEYKGLPRGSVECYQFDQRDGFLKLLNREPLALSATMPRSMAISPDGRFLVVAVDGGGSYNMLPILPDGRLGRVSGVFKEVGRGPVVEQQASAHPQAVCFDASGTRFFSVDLGCDRLSVFSTDGGLQAECRHPLPAGSGPRFLQYHPSGRLLFIAHALEPGLSVFAYDQQAGTLAEVKTDLALRAMEGIVLHPSGNFLAAASDGLVRAYQVRSHDAHLDLVGSRRVGNGEQEQAVRGMVFGDDGGQLITLTREGVERIGFDADAGFMGHSEVAIRHAEARSIVLV